jgi:hypothetical protein
VSGALTYEGLYGGEAGPASDPAAAMTARFVVPRGTTPSAPLTVPFVARAVQVDNASGSWYLVNGRRVPPWTVSAVVSLDPPAPQLTVEATAPDGHRAEAVGEDLILVATEAGLAPFGGIYIPPVRAFAFQLARTTARVTEAGIAGVLYLNPNPAAALVLVAVDLVAGGTANARTRGLVVGSVGYGGAPPLTLITNVAISPGAPHDFRPIDPQAGIVPAGGDITYSLATQRGAGSTDAQLAVGFYEVA